MRLIGFLKRIFNKAFKVNKFHSSQSYWDKRYKHGGNSGAGSYNRLREFKAEIINEFVKSKGIQKVIEHGCGDGSQLSLAEYPNYIGFDVSSTSIELCKSKFSDSKNKIFKNSNEYKDEKADLVLSLDVIYHLVEDDVYEKYMQRLFNSSVRYVIVYSSNIETNIYGKAAHVRHRKFSDWIEKNKSEWSLTKYIVNKYPYDSEDQLNTSFADFYFYEKADA